MPMITPGILNLDLYGGADWEAVLEYRDSLGALVNLTGYSARMKARETYPAAAAVVDISTAAGGITLGGAAGTITLTLDSTDTAAIDATLGHRTTALVYDLEVIDGTGYVVRLVQGTLTVYPEATR